MRTFHFIGSQTQTFPDLEGPDGGPLVLEPGATVELAEDPGSPWLVEDPKAPEAKAIASGVYGTEVPDDPPAKPARKPRKPRKATGKKAAARTAKAAADPTSDAGDAGDESPSE